MILTDAHTHAYDCYDLDAFVEAAFHNCTRAIDHHRAAPHALLFVAETPVSVSFQALLERIDGPDNKRRKWRGFKTTEPCSMGLAHDHYPGVSLFYAR